MCCCYSCAEVFAFVFLRCSVMPSNEVLVCTWVHERETDEKSSFFRCFLSSIQHGMAQHSTRQRVNQNFNVRMNKVK